MQIKTFQIRISDEFISADELVINHFMQSIKVKSIARHFIESERMWTISLTYDIMDGEKLEPVKIEPIPEQAKIEMTPELEAHRYESLRQWRSDKAACLDVPLFMIASNEELLDIALADINKPEDLMQIKGFREKKIAKHGDDIVALLNSI